MLRYLLIIIALPTVTICCGQKYYSTDIIKKADSILKASVGENIFKNYYHYDSKSYYTYQKRSGKIDYKTLTESKITKGKFINMAVRYNFCLNKYNIPCNATYIAFDSLLRITQSINMDFIPAYIIRNDSCNFLSDSSALTIAKDSFKEKGINPIHVYLEWDSKEKLYVWTAYNILTEQKDGFGNNYGKGELLRINAVTGDILSLTKNEYGALY